MFFSFLFFQPFINSPPFKELFFMLLQLSAFTYGLEITALWVGKLATPCIGLPYEQMKVQIKFGKVLS